jgi:hypothetical protein
MRLETDASGSGWGAGLWSLHGVFTLHGEFSDEELLYDIMVKEELAIVNAVNGLEECLRDCMLDLYTDNEVVWHTVLRGSVPQLHMREVARALLNFQLRANVLIRIACVSTTENMVADALSRVGLSAPAASSSRQYRLDAAYFAHLQSWYSDAFTVDLCSHPGNAQLPHYVVGPDMEDSQAIRWNAFMWCPQPGAPEFVYCYPPFVLIPALWRHFRLSRMRGVLLAPNDASQQWFGALRGDAVSWAILAFAVLGKRFGWSLGHRSGCPMSISTTL